LSDGGRFYLPLSANELKYANYDGLSGKDGGSKRDEYLDE